MTALAFIATLGAWKLVTSFGFRPVALAAGLAVVAATLSHPFWVPVLFGWNPAGTFDDWVGMFVVASALTGWLMAALALLLAPVRLAMGWQNARRRRRVQAREEGRAP